MTQQKCVFLQVKYKEAGKREASSALYHRLPETLETQRVKEVTELQSEVRASIIHFHLLTCSCLSCSRRHEQSTVPMSPHVKTELRHFCPGCEREELRLTALFLFKELMNE